MSLFDRRSPEARFWDWFVDNRTTLAKPLTPRIADELTRRLQQVHPELTWEAGPMPDGTFEFAVSADGIKTVAPHVRDLVAVAPAIPGWTIRAFRQPGPAFGIQMGDRKLTLDDLAFIVETKHADGRADLTILIRDLSGATRDSLVGATFILLDSLLGEETVMFRLGAIDFVPLAEGDGRERPIAELPTLLAAG